MNNVKKYAISLSVMIVVSIVSIVIVSTLTYLLKWQADKAMIGIIVTYVVTGFSGGVCHGGKRKILSALLMGTIFVLLLAALAYLGFQIPFELSKRFLLIWLLIVCSTFVGMCMKREL